LNMISMIVLSQNGHSLPAVRKSGTDMKLTNKGDTAKCQLQI
jgi:hypothetical protein